MTVNLTRLNLLCDFALNTIAEARQELQAAATMEEGRLGSTATILSATVEMQNRFSPHSASRSRPSA
jgi:hypothetical protein